MSTGSGKNKVCQLLGIEFPLSFDIENRIGLFLQMVVADEEAKSLKFKTGLRRLRDLQLMFFGIPVRRIFTG